MKLFEIKPGTEIRVLGDIKTPVASPDIKAGDILKFYHIDGMYSYCKDSEGNTVHLVAWAEVETTDI